MKPTGSGSELLAHLISIGAGRTNRSNSARKSLQVNTGVLDSTGYWIQEEALNQHSPWDHQLRLYPLVLYLQLNPVQKHHFCHTYTHRRSHPFLCLRACDVLQLTTSPLGPEVPGIPLSPGIPWSPGPPGSPTVPAGPAFP